MVEVFTSPQAPVMELKPKKKDILLDNQEVVTMETVSQNYVPGILIKVDSTFMLLIEIWTNIMFKINLQYIKCLVYLFYIGFLYYQKILQT